MTTNELQKEFTKIHTELTEYTNGQLLTYRRKNTIKRDYLDIPTVLSECYIHIDKCKEEIKTISQLISYCKKFIRSNIYWYNSKINLLMKPNSKNTSPAVNAW